MNVYNVIIENKLKHENSFTEEKYIQLDHQEILWIVVLSVVSPSVIDPNSTHKISVSRVST